MGHRRGLPLTEVGDFHFYFSRCSRQSLPHLYGVHCHCLVLFIYSGVLCTCVVLIVEQASRVHRVSLEPAETGRFLFQSPFDPEKGHIVYGKK